MAKESKKSTDLQEELEFLRFFFKEMKKLLGGSGTDEVSWVMEDYEEQTGKQVPYEYFH